MNPEPSTLTLTGSTLTLTGFQMQGLNKSVILLNFLACTAPEEKAVARVKHVFTRCAYMQAEDGDGEGQLPLHWDGTCGRHKRFPCHCELCKLMGEMGIMHPWELRACLRKLYKNLQSSMAKSDQTSRSKFAATVCTLVGNTELIRVNNLLVAKIVRT